MNWLTFAMSLLPAPAVQDAQAARPTVIVVVGADGTAEYGRQFSEWSARWAEAARRADARHMAIGPDAESGTLVRDALHAALMDAARRECGPLWLVLIGHGTWDGRTARFNLSGPDVSAAELAAWLDAVQRPTVIVNCTSSSGPFLSRLAGPDRMVVTATRSGQEFHFARFGDALSLAITDPAADLDRDGQTSLLEAWLTACKRTEAFYKGAGRLATEHALLDDNGDGLGVQPAAFEGVRPVASAAAPTVNSFTISAAAPDAAPALLPDGLRAHQMHLVISEHEAALPPEVRARRNALELDLAGLRERKPELSEDEYLDRLETVLLELAELYEMADGR